MGYIHKNYDILGKNFRTYYWIYWLKIVGYICQNYAIQWSIGFIRQKLRNVLGKMMGYKRQKRRGYICKTMEFIQKDNGI